MSTATGASQAAVASRRPRFRAQRHALLGMPLAGLMLVGYVLPLVLVLGVSLGDGTGQRPFASGLSIAKYVAQFQSPYVWRVIVFTLVVSAAIAVFNALLAYPMALFLARSRSRWRGLAFLVSFTPLAVGMNMLTIGWLIMLGKTGVINAVLQGLGITNEPVSLVYGVTAVAIGLAHVSFTFMLLPIESVLRGIDPLLERAARSLGASPARAFATVTLPLSLEGVAAGMLIVFMQSCGAFVIPLFLGGTGTVMLPVAIWEQMTVANDWPAGAVLAITLTALALAVLAIQLRFFNPLRGAGQP